MRDSKSLSPIGDTLPNALLRLHNTTNQRERIVMEVWQKWNTPSKTGAVPVHAVLQPIPGKTTYAPEEIAIMAATIQWLGTHCGAGFLRDVLQTAQAKGVPFYEVHNP